MYSSVLVATFLVTQINALFRSLRHFKNLSIVISTDCISALLCFEDAMPEEFNGPLIIKLNRLGLSTSNPAPYTRLLDLIFTGRQPRQGYKNIDITAVRKQKYILSKYIICKKRNKTITFLSRVQLR